MKLEQFYALCLTVMASAGFSLSGLCAPAPEHENQTDTYIVEKGDTLYAISVKYGLNYRELAAYNAIENPGSISVGQEIQLPHVAKKTTEPSKAVAANLAHMTGAAERWGVIQKTMRPKLLVRLCDEFKRDYPDTQYTPEVKRILKGAKKALSSQIIAELADDELEILKGQMDRPDDLVKALRGDKDAAYLIAQMYRDGRFLKNSRRNEQWLKFAAELGHSLACWQLSELYLSTGQQADAARYEKLAISLGFVPPLRLSNRGY